jgi:hypothetical protein
MEPDKNARIVTREWNEKRSFFQYWSVGPYEKIREAVLDAEDSIRKFAKLDPTMAACVATSQVSIDEK